LGERPAIGRTEISAAQQLTLISHIGADFIVASGKFTVERPATPQAAVTGQLEISLAGFPSDSAIYMSLYGPLADQSYPLLLDLPVVTTNGNGEALAQWTIPSGTLPGQYAVLINPPPNHCVADQGCLKFSVGA
jgi:hypothetical protein